MNKIVNIYFLVAIALLIGTIAIAQPVKNDSCTQGWFFYPNMRTATNFSYLGSSSLNGNVVEINKGVFFDVGAVWYPSSVPVRYGFISRFTYSINSRNQGDAKDNSAAGADGFAFVIQNWNTSAIGTLGDGIGYAGISNSLAVEFDTYNDSWNTTNKWNDPNGNHVAVQSRGVAPNTSYHNSLATLGINSKIPDLCNGGEVQIDYNYVPNTFRVLINKVEYIVIPDLDLNSILKLENSENAFIGFTAACANASENHSISNWFFCPLASKLNDVYITSRSKVICQGDTLTLFATPGFESYQWSNGKTGDRIVITEPGQYTVTAKTPKGVEYTSAVFEVLVNQLPNPKIYGDSVICQSGKTGRIWVEDKFLKYDWSTGDTTFETKVSKSGYYYLTVVDSNGCQNTVNIKIETGEEVLPEIIITGNIPICRNDSISMKTSKVYSKYKWSTGDTTSTITVKNAGDFFVEVTDLFGCTGISAKLNIKLAPYNPPLISGTKSICEGSEGFLKVDNIYQSYSWSTGETSNQIKILKSGKYSVTVRDFSGCNYDTSIVVTNDGFLNIKIVGSSILCPEEKSVLSLDKPYSKYSWSTGESSPAITISKTGTYIVTVFDQNGCSGSDSIKIVGVDVALDGLDSLAFSLTFPGDRNSLPVKITNPGNVDIRLGNFSIKSGSAIFSIGSGINNPLTIKSNESYQFDLLFKPVDFLDYNDSLQIEILEPCKLVLLYPVKGPTKNKMFFSFPDLTLKPDSKPVKIPVKLKSDFESSIKFDISALISFDNKSLMVTDCEGCKLDSVYNNGNRTNLLVSADSLKVKKADEVIFNLIGTFMLGNDQSTINFENIDLNRLNLIPYNKDGSLKSTGVCKSSLNQLQLIPQAEFSISPNPAGSELNLIIENAKNQRFNIQIFSAIGELRKNLLLSGNDKYDLKLNLNDLPQGLYFLKIYSEFQNEIRPVIIIR